MPKTLNDRNDLLDSRAYFEDLMGRWVQYLQITDGPYAVTPLELYAAFYEWLGEKNADLQEKFMATFPQISFTRAMKGLIKQDRKGRRKRYRPGCFLINYRVRPKKKMVTVCVACPSCGTLRGRLTPVPEPTAEELKEQLRRLEEADKNAAPPPYQPRFGTALPPITELIEAVEESGLFPDVDLQETFDRYQKVKRRIRPKRPAPHRP